MLLKPVKLKALSKARYEKLVKRSQIEIDKLFNFVKSIFNDIKENGDMALLKYIKKYDKVELDVQGLVVTKDEIRQAYRRISPQMKKDLEEIIKSVQGYHSLQKTQSWYALKNKNSLLGRKICPFDTAGIYVPGGKATYPTSAIMGIVPAKLSGVKNIIVCTPPKGGGRIPPEVLVACDIAGADKIIKAGGAQAIAALACGTKGVPKVDIIVGPGNVYVTAAKSYVAAIGCVAYDFPAGPSEILIIADASGNSEYIVSDMFAQAEHDEHACAILVTTSKRLAQEVSWTIDKEIRNGKRKQPIKKSLENYGAILLVERLSQAIDFCNEFAPEHVEVMTSDNEPVVKKIRNAGSIYIGPYSPVAAGDYRSGTNHILPTGGAARWASALSVENFMKRLPVQGLDFETLKKMADTIYRVSRVEGLYSGHGLSVKKRIEKPLGKEYVILKNPLSIFNEKKKEILL